MKNTSLIAAVFLLLLAGCATKPTEPQRVLTPVDFSELFGWQADNINEALPALRRSCGKIAQKAEWSQPCSALGNLNDNDPETARRYFETWFRPYAVSDNGNAAGLFTGYYEAELHGSLLRYGQYQTPLYAKPGDLITVDLADFSPDWKGKRITGKVVNHKLKPYDDRSEIVKGSLTNRAQIIAWVDDPVAAFFLAVQGSGRINLDTGDVMRVGYDGANGQDYVSIGRQLAESGDLPRPVTMQSIREWMKVHPGRADEVMNMNPSYVFFRILQGEGPIGAEDVALTPRRSLAVDPRYVALGTPVWLDSSDGNNQALQRLMIAQDTGGAIKGVVRGDFFWGFGPEAEAKAGPMQSKGRYYVLLPKSVTANDR